MPSFLYHALYHLSNNTCISDLIFQIQAASQKLSLRSSSMFRDFLSVPRNGSSVSEVFRSRDSCLGARSLAHQSAVLIRSSEVFSAAAEALMIPCYCLKSLHTNSSDDFRQSARLHPPGFCTGAFLIKSFPGYGRLHCCLCSSPELELQQ